MSGRGESGWRIHANPCLIHVNVWQKPLQYYNVISLQLIKINGKKIKKKKKKRREKQRRKGKIYPFECKVPKNTKVR